MDTQAFIISHDRHYLSLQARAYQVAWAYLGAQWMIWTVMTRRWSELAAAATILCPPLVPSIIIHCYRRSQRAARTSHTNTDSNQQRHDRPLNMNILPNFNARSHLPQSCRRRGSCSIQIRRILSGAGSDLLPAPRGMSQLHFFRRWLRHSTCRASPVAKAVQCRCLPPGSACRDGNRLLRSFALF